MRALTTKKPVEVMVEDLARALFKRFYKVTSFTSDQMADAIDLAVRRGAETKKEIIDEAINFLYA